MDDAKGISPLTKNRIAKDGNPKVPVKSNAELNAVYENLKLHAHEAKPNVAKAKLVNDGFVKRAANSIKDTGVDCSNYVRAIKKGDLNDNQIGRINDLGLKIGAGLIATFLALNAKTKKMAAMEFVGAATFLASMKLWPKLFINLPAKLVHGFPIDKKYISARGEKKDFFMDNQFIPWDVYTKEDLEKIGKKTGIDINSPNGEEKIKRKMQKTALQNRTLWMATAGFATPLMTSLACNALEPRIENGIIKHGFKKVQDVIAECGDEGIQKYIKEITPDEKSVLRSQAELDKLFKGSENRLLDDKFFEELASKLGISSLRNEFRNKEDFKVIADFDSRTGLFSELKNLYNNSAEYNREKLASKLLGLSDKSKIVPKNLSKETVDSIIGELNDSTDYNALVDALAKKGYDYGDILNNIPRNSLGGEYTIKDILEEVELLPSKSADVKLTQDDISKLLGDGPLTLSRVRKLLSNCSRFDRNEAEEILKNTEIDNTGFFESLRAFNKEFALGVKAKIKKLVSLINPVAGERSESMYTKEYLDTIRKLFKEMGLTNKQIKQILSENPGERVPTVLMEFFQNKAKNGADYEQFIKTFYEKIQTPKEVADCVRTLSDGALSISGGANVKPELKSVADAMLGTKTNAISIVDTIKNSLSLSTTNIEAFKAKILLISGLERRIASGDLKQAFIDNGLINEEWTVERLTNLAREAVYDSSVGLAAQRYNAQNVSEEFKNIVFGLGDKYADAYKIEKDIPGAKEGIESAIRFMTQDGGNISKKTYIGASGFADQIGKAAKTLKNNKIWKKIFVTGAIALAAITLLAQPFFGNIKKEYPENKKSNKK